MIRSDPQRTQSRIHELHRYMQAEVMADGVFQCSDYGACRASRADYPFYEGQLSHVGRHYDLEVDGRPMRIIFVGQEYGHSPARVGLAKRSEMVAQSAERDFRDRGRNPHMKGTASLLRLFLGRRPGTDAEGERLFDGAHIFEGFALVNYLLCSAVRETRDPFGETFTGAAKGFSSPTMRRNCGRHFRRTLEILEPTVIVVQGQGVRRWLADTLSLPAKGPISERVRIGGSQADLLTFNHPSAGGASGYWGGSPNSRYLRETITPAVELYRTSWITSRESLREGDARFKNI